MKYAIATNKFAPCTGSFTRHNTIIYIYADGSWDYGTKYTRSIGLFYKIAKKFFRLFKINKIKQWQIRYAISVTHYKIKRFLRINFDDYHDDLFEEF